MRHTGCCRSKTLTPTPEPCGDARLLFTVVAGGLRPRRAKTPPIQRNAIDVGPLKRARELEALGFLHMALPDKLGTGYGSAVKIIS